MSKAIKVTLTAAFAAAVEQYQKDNDIETLAKAVAILAAIGYETATGLDAPEPTNQHGGWRGSEASIKALMDYADRVTDFGRNDPMHYNEDTQTFDE